MISFLRGFYQGCNNTKFITEKCVHANCSSKREITNHMLELLNFE